MFIIPFFNRPTFSLLFLASFLSMYPHRLPFMVVQAIFCLSTFLLHSSFIAKICHSSCQNPSPSASSHPKPSISLFLLLSPLSGYILTYLDLSCIMFFIPFLAWPTFFHPSLLSSLLFLLSLFLFPFPLARLIIVACSDHA